MGKIFIMAGVILIDIGLLLTMLSHFSFFRLGRLSGDIYIRRGSFSFYFPLVICLLLSLLLTLVFSLVSRK